MRLLLLLALLVFAQACAGHITPRMRKGFDGAAEYHHVNPVILKAIARVESGYNPSAINRNGNGSYDIRLMQINSARLPQLRKFGVTLRRSWIHAPAPISAPGFFPKACGSESTPGKPSARTTRRRRDSMCGMQARSTGLFCKGVYLIKL